MFRNRRYTPKRKRDAQRKLEKAKAELALAQEVSGIEREAALVTTQIDLVEQASQKLTRHQQKLLKSTSKKAIAAQIQGMNDQVEKSLPKMLESRHQAGLKMMKGTTQQLILDVKSRSSS